MVSTTWCRSTRRVIRQSSKALEAIRPDVFTKGGDRVDARTIPEWEVCEAIGAEIVTGVGRSKEWSSSWFLDNWRKG